MHTVLIVIHVLLAIAMIGMVLVQRGPGATAGAAFGSGASSTVFGSRGAGSFLTRTTAVLATGFFLISLGLAVLVSRGGYAEAAQDLGIMQSAAQQGEQQPAEQAQPQPAQPPAAGDVPTAPPQAGAADTNSDVPQAPPARQESKDNGDGGDQAGQSSDGGN